MKKLFNYALLAAALLVGVNVNAGNEVSLSINGGAATEYAKFTDALKAICEAAQNNTEAEKTEATITLLTDVADFGYVDGLPKDGDNDDRIKLNNGEYITIDLAGKTLTTQLRFNIYRAGIILTGKEGSKFNTAKTQVFTMYGAGNNTAPTGASKFVLDKNVVLTNTVSGAINSMYCLASLGSSSNTYSGIQMDIYGKVFATGDGCTAFATSGNNKFKETDMEAIPQIHFYPGSELHSSNNTVLTTTFTKPEKITEAGQDPAKHKTSASAIYAPGVANLVVEGLVEGGVGIYAKAGHITLNGAVVRATAPEYSAPIAYGNGFYGCGSAIILDSHEGYGELSGVEISNSTIVSDHGYAIEEVATQGQTKLPDIDVNSGTFVGGQGAITTTAEEREKIKDEGSIGGGEWHNTDVTPYLDPNKNTVIEFEDSEGKHYQVVVPISKEDMESHIADAAAKAEEERYAYIKEGTPEIVSSNMAIDFLLVDSAATVIVQSGAVLDAGTLMTEGSQIAGKGTGKVIVEAGGTLIISGKQGAYTYDENSLVVKASQEASGQILINPAVVLNTTPKATVEFVSNSYYKDGVYVFQFFGSPMLAGKVSSVTTNGSANCAMQVNRGGSNWESIGTIITGVNTIDVTKFDVPFGFYSIQSKNDKENLQTYVFQGNLYGNTSPNIDFEQGWPGFSNAYMANTNVSAFFDVLFYQTEDPSIYTYEQVGKDKLVWTANNPLDWSVTDLKPMNAFMLRNTNAKQQLALDYTAMVWNPAMGIEPNNAPRLSHIEKASIFVKDANGVYDKLTIAQDDQFSAAYDKGFDAEKFMNAELNIYVKGEKNLAIAATDNLENTYVGFNCNNAGKYALSFENVTGNFALLDTKTNACIAMNEGSTYEFIANAGEDAYRFMIVRGAQAPTEMQKTNAAIKANKALVNGQIVINNGERFFNVLGNEVK